MGDGDIVGRIDSVLLVVLSVIVRVHLSYPPHQDWLFFYHRAMT